MSYQLPVWVSGTGAGTTPGVNTRLHRGLLIATDYPASLWQRPRLLPVGAPPLHSIPAKPGWQPTSPIPDPRAAWRLPKLLPVGAPPLPPLGDVYPWQATKPPDMSAQWAAFRVQLLPVGAAPIGVPLNQWVPGAQPGSWAYYQRVPQGQGGAPPGPVVALYFRPVPC